MSFGNFMAVAGIAVLITLVIALAVLFPFFWIWAANTLFGFSIPYTFKTWVASAVLSSFFRGSVAVRKND